MSKADCRWVSEQTILAIHDEQIAEHGGMPGVREMSLVQSSIHRPRNIASFGSPDIADLAAAYAYGICNNHGFLDGNKRTAFVAAYVFLLDQGFDLSASDPEAVSTLLAVAAGEMSEIELAVWFRGYIHPLS
jgi:death-on-curing protein